MEDKVVKDRKIHKLIMTVSKYAATVIIVVASFFYGRFYESYNTPEVEKEVVTKVEKENVSLAIDESENLIVIDKNTGHYTVYQDSLGHYIFNLYAKSIWAQHSNK